jgi:hypothetical protein
MIFISPGVVFLNEDVKKSIGRGGIRTPNFNLVRVALWPLSYAPALACHSIRGPGKSSSRAMAAIPTDPAEDTR